MSTEPPPGSQPPAAAPTPPEPAPTPSEPAPPEPAPTAPDAAPTQSWAAQPAAATPPPAAPPPPVAWESPEVAAGPAPGIEFAPHGGRLVAYILDSIIIAIGFSILFFIAFFAYASGATFDGDRITSISGGAAILGTLFVILAFLFLFAYFPFFWARGGSTLGMRPFSLRVVRDRDGGRIGWGTAILRLIGLYVAGAVLYIGFIWIFIDKRRRGWQDLIAGTVVIKQG